MKVHVLLARRRREEKRRKIIYVCIQQVGQNEKQNIFNRDPFPAEFVLTFYQVLQEFLWRRRTNFCSGRRKMKRFMHK